MLLDRRIKVMSTICISDEKLLPWRDHEDTFRIGQIFAKCFSCRLSAGLLQSNRRVNQPPIKENRTIKMLRSFEVGLRNFNGSEGEGFHINPWQCFSITCQFISDDAPTRL